MSFILDALRKVDRESRESREAVPPVATVEKLRRERKSRRTQYAAMAAIGILSALATTFLLRQAPPASQAPTVPGSAPATPPEAAHAAAEPPGETLSMSPETSEPSGITPPPSEEPVGETMKAASAEKNTGDVGVADAPVPELPQLVLQGTSVLAGKSVAVVSDRRVFVGDFIEGALVVRIEERLVELEYGGRRFTLTF
jgi:hypothetical protein